MIFCTLKCLNADLIQHEVAQGNLNSHTLKNKLQLLKNKDMVLYTEKLNIKMEEAF
jgi:hypothetical protein